MDRTFLETYGLRRDAALESAGNLSLDPRKLTAGLLLAARARGARFYAPVEATGFSHSADGVEVVTAGGPVIRAAHVVLATGYELHDPVPAKRHGSSPPGQSPPGGNHGRSGRTPPSCGRPPTRISISVPHTTGG